jgi:predicted metal-dependent hydrolase
MKSLLRRIGSFGRKESPAPAIVQAGGRDVTVSFRRNRQARRIIIRLSRNRTGVVVTLPTRTSRAEALAFVIRSEGWIAERLAAESPATEFAHGCALPLRGEPHVIAHDDARRGAVRCADGRIHVAGDVAHLPRRVTDWLKREARRDLIAASEKYANLMEVAFHAVSVRDQKSRWGSCSADGSLSYSWRLVLAPSFVLDYVAAHEVAHLKHMNHGKQFWRLVLTHCRESAAARTWLKRHGASLHRYGKP